MIVPLHNGGCMEPYTRTIDEVWRIWQLNARSGLHPFAFTTYEDNERVLSRLTSLEREPWAEAYSAAARPFEALARQAEAKGDSKLAREHYLHAHRLYRMARFPTKSPAKCAAYRNS